MKDQFVFSSKLKSGLIATMGLGLIIFLIGAFISKDNVYRIWSVILHNSLFFTLVALASAFFICIHTLGLGGWIVVMRRIPESITTFITRGALILIAIMIAMYLDSHGIVHTGFSKLYHWMEPGITDPNSANYDSVLAWKKGFLNWNTFIVLTLVFLGLWWFLAKKFRETSLLEDKEGGLRPYQLSKKWAAYFAVVFAVSSSVFAWLWNMSINPHWYSTLFGWYSFISFFVTGITVITLIAIFLKEQGYLTFMNDNHFHDLGKYMFGFSIFWTYLFFSQYMLIWYANIPEETAYFKYLRDTGGYRFWFWICFIINFFVPFLALMKRENKRNLNQLRIIGIVIIFGHWLDYFLMIIPGSLKHNGTGHFSNLWILELGCSMFFVGFFLYTTFNYLGKVPLYPKNHPMIKESLTHQI